MWSRVFGEGREGGDADIAVWLRHPDPGVVRVLAVHVEGEGHQACCCPVCTAMDELPADQGRAVRCRWKDARGRWWGPADPDEEAPEEWRRVAPVDRAWEDGGSSSDSGGGPPTQRASRKRARGERAEKKEGDIKSQRDQRKRDRVTDGRAAAKPHVMTLRLSTVAGRGERSATGMGEWQWALNYVFKLMVQDMMFEANSFRPGMYPLATASRHGASRAHRRFFCTKGCDMPAWHARFNNEPRFGSFTDMYLVVEPPAAG